MVFSELKQKIYDLYEQIGQINRKIVEYKREIKLFNEFRGDPNTETSKSVDDETSNSLVEMFKEKKCQIDQNCEDFVVSFQNIFNLLGESYALIVVALNNVKISQNLASYGNRVNIDTYAPNDKTTPSSGFDEIQPWTTKIADLMCDTCSSIESIRLSENDDQLTSKLNAIHSNIEKMFEKLVVSCFVVEEQPLQVVKKDRRFSTRVRLLLDERIFGEKQQVIVSILSEEQSKDVQYHGADDLTKSSGTMAKNTGPWEPRPIPSRNSSFVCHFKGVVVTEVTRNKDKGRDYTSDELFSLLYQTKVVAFGKTIDVWVMSWPIVVCVHEYQEAKAWATITWNNISSNKGDNPFAFDDEIPWASVAWALDTKFLFHTGCRLSDEDLLFLGNKLRGNQLIDLESQQISWQQFCKTKFAPHSKFTFFEWFYAILRLMRDFLSGPWNDGLVIGFISKKDTDRMLLNHRAGTFLLRFTETVLGGVSIACTEIDSNKSLKVSHYQPYFYKDFEAYRRINGNPYRRTIGDMIKSMTKCKYLYPNEVENSFSKYDTRIVEDKTHLDIGYWNKFTHVRL